MSDPSLTKTLPLQLSFEEPESDGQLLLKANHEARSVYNQTIRDARNGVDWDAIHNRVESNLVKNSQQRVVEKALDAMRNYHEYDDYGKPSYAKSDPYPLRMNFNEGYTLSEEDGGITFRISPKPYNPIRGTVSGDPAHIDILRTALNSDAWKVGTAEAFFSDGRAELHVNVTNKEQHVRSLTDSRTVVGVDINEDNIALTAVSNDTVVDSLVIDFPEIKRIRHEYFVMRKRIQNAGKSSYDTLFERQEERFVHDAVHKISRAVVRFAV